MERICNWLTNEWTGWKLLLGSIVCLGLTLAYLKLIMIIGIGYFQSGDKPIPPPPTTSLLIVLGFYFLLSALFEELAFRVPLFFTARLFGPKGFIISIIILSVFFGILHGSVYNILLQGVYGVFYCIVFIKSGGLGMNLKPLRAWFITAAVHASYNVAIMFFPQLFTY